jgi:ATP synthase F1 complex assembly factor 1
MNNFLKFTRKGYFSYPCPRKLREIVKISLFEREQPSTIKDLWKQYYEEKPRAFGLNVNENELNIMLRNANNNPFFIFPVRKNTGYYMLVLQNQEKSFVKF